MTPFWIKNPGTADWWGRIKPSPLVDRTDEGFKRISAKLEHQRKAIIDRLFTLTNKR